MKIFLLITSIIIGAAVGWLFYSLIGCKSGGLPLTSNVWSSVIIGAIIGFMLLFPIVEKYLKDQQVK